MPELGLILTRYQCNGRPMSMLRPDPGGLGGAGAVPADGPDRAWVRAAVHHHPVSTSGTEASSCCRLVATSINLDDATKCVVFECNL